MRFSMASFIASVVALSATATTTLAFKSSDFLVDGKRLPGISNVIGDVGSSWAGLLPITAQANDTNKLFFWLWPPAQGAPDKDLTIWFGGGPGCSGLGEMFQGHGPFVIPKTHQNKTIVQKNPHSWTQTGWVLYIDQPGVTGFSQVDAPNLDENIIARQFRGFLANVYTTFPDLAKKNLFLSGESYGSQFISHIADYLYDQTGQVDRVPLKGAGLVSGRYLSDTWQVEIPLYDYVVNRQKDLQLNETVMREVTKRADELGLVGFVNKTLTYPPKGPITAPAKLLANKDDPLSYTVIPHLLEVNDCFDYYNIRSRCPELNNPLSSRGGDFINTTPGFKKAIHVDDQHTWKSCTRPRYIFPNDDPTPLPMEDGSLSRLIDRSEKVVMYGGQDDFKLLSLGTQLGLQNITWGGMQGFQTRPRDRLYAQGKDVGVYRTERKLTWAVVDRAGHFVPGECSWRVRGADDATLTPILF